MFLLLVAVLSLGGCAGPPEPETHYLLRAAAGQSAGRVDAPRRIALGRVDVAPYLSQPGIVVQTAPGQVHSASLHRWAEPLQDGLRSMLRSEISKALGEQVSSSSTGLRARGRFVDVYVDRLHGTMAGTAEIDATYRIGPNDRSAEPIEFRFLESTSLESEGYPGLVDAESELIGRLAESIANSLRDAQ